MFIALWVVLAYALLASAIIVGLRYLLWRQWDAERRQRRYELRTAKRWLREIHRYDERNPGFSVKVP